MAKPTTEEIIASPVFKALNMRIDSMKDQMIVWGTSLKNGVIEAFEENTTMRTIRTRTHEEAEAQKRNAEEVIPFAPHRIKQLDYAMNEVLRLEREIGELQRFKLRLLNDYDFTHGDDAEQRAVFG